jgi:hypothetical protein
VSYSKQSLELPNKRTGPLKAVDERPELTQQLLRDDLGNLPAEGENVEQRFRILLHIFRHIVSPKPSSIK